MYSTPVDLSFSYLRSAVEASLDIKKVHMEPNTGLICSRIIVEEVRHSWPILRHLCWKLFPLPWYIGPVSSDQDVELFRQLFIFGDSSLMEYGVAHEWGVA